MPEIDHGVFAAHNGFQHGLIFGHEFVERGADEANVFAQLGPIAVSKGVAQDLDVAPSGELVAGQGGEQCGFAAAVGPEHGPVFTALYSPV